MNYLRKISDVFIKQVSLVSFLDDQELIISPKKGYFSEDDDLEIQFDNIYFTANTAYLTQDGNDTASGYLYEKEFGMQFPLSEIVTEVINRFRAVKYIRLHYCNGKIVNISRNDIKLNKPLIAKTKIEGKFLSISWTNKSIFSIAFQ